MVCRQRTRKVSGTRRWGNRIRIFLMPFMLIAIVLKNRQRILNRVRYFNKRYLNPQMLRRAEYHTVYYAVIQHTGRRSGQKYATPVVADFSIDRTSVLIPLPYGAETDWCRNVLAGGRCTISKNGMSYSIVEPQILNAPEALRQLPARDRIRWRAFGIAQFLSVHLEGPIEAEQSIEPMSTARPVQVAS